MLLCWLFVCCVLLVRVCARQPLKKKLVFLAELQRAHAHSHSFESTETEPHSQARPAFKPTQR